MVRVELPSNPSRIQSHVLVDWRDEGVERWAGIEGSEDHVGEVAGRDVQAEAVSGCDFFQHLKGWARCELVELVEDTGEEHRLRRVSSQFQRLHHVGSEWADGNITVSNRHGNTSSGGDDHQRDLVIDSGCCAHVVVASRDQSELVEHSRESRLDHKHSVGGSDLQLKLASAVWAASRLTAEEITGLGSGVEVGDDRLRLEEVAVITLNACEDDETEFVRISNDRLLRHDECRHVVWASQVEGHTKITAGLAGHAGFDVGRRIIGGRQVADALGTEAVRGKGAELGVVVDTTLVLEGESGL